MRNFLRNLKKAQIKKKMPIEADLGI